MSVSVACRFSQTNPPSIGAATWFDISEYVISYDMARGKQRILDRFEPGTLNLVLRNTDRRFDPLNAASPYPPLTSDHVNAMIPLRLIQFGFTVNGVTTWVFTGVVERWPQVWQGPTWAEVDLTAVDLFEFLSNHFLASTYATAVFSLTGYPFFRRLLYTSVIAGYVGNLTTITHLASGTNTPLSVSVAGTDVTVHLATDGGGSPISTANDVIAAVAASAPASALVIASNYGFAPGDTVVPAAAQTPLTGGTFVQELTGSRINALLDFIAWPAAPSQRTVSPGNETIQAQVIAQDGSTTALDHAYAVEQSENGAFFIDKMGNAVFLDRTALASQAYQTPVATLTDAKGANVGTFPYQATKGDFDKDLIYNNIRVSRVNGNLSVATDGVSDTTYFTRSLSLSTLTITDSAAQDFAKATLLRFKQPYFRFEPLEMFPGANLSFWQTLVTFDLLQTVNVVRNPPGGGEPISQNGQLIHIGCRGSRDVKNTVWTVQVDPGLGNVFFTLDDPTKGALDSIYGLGY